MGVGPIPARTRGGHLLFILIWPQVQLGHCALIIRCPLSCGSFQANARTANENQFVIGPNPIIFGTIPVSAKQTPIAAHRVKWFGDIDCPKPYKFKGCRWVLISQTPVLPDKDSTKHMSCSRRASCGPAGVPKLPGCSCRFVKVLRFAVSDVTQ